ncbi:MAG: cell division protein ZipA [Pseudomonadales bacterium]|nr:cell division protein ZipA [Pseudomonadales bacterium]
MEFGLREVLIGVGLLVIAGILFDGFRRMRRSKEGSLGMPSEMGGSMDEEWGYFKGELPNGGARVVNLNRQEPDISSDFDNDDYKELEPIGNSKVEPEEDYIDDALYADIDDRIDSRPRKVTDIKSSRKVDEPDPFVDPDPEDSVQAYVNESLEMEAAADTGAEPEGEYREVQTDLFSDDEMLERAKAEQERQLAAHYSGQQEKAAQSSNRKSKARKVSAEPTRKPVEPEPPAEDIDLGVTELADVIVINVMAKPGEEIAGVDLYRALTSCGFHHGDMDIFHRYEQHNGQGRLLFSVANVVEPGTFDRTNAETFATPGVCMFLKLPGPKRALQAFDVMVDSSRKISKLLGADTKDENHSIMTQQTFEHYRQRVMDFERKQLSQKALTR